MTNEGTGPTPRSRAGTRARPAPRAPRGKSEPVDLATLRAAVLAEVGKAVVGQDDVVETVLAAAIVGGHVLLEGVPGVAKTLLANAFARAFGIEFRRAQFTPDMLPSDVTGTLTLRGGDLVFRPGPVFTNLLLADEINRTPPKTQAALLEAMQERQVTLDGEPRALPDPFIVIATQNPIEYEGTYPLPEAQLDRFLVKIDVGYPGEDHEVAMLRLAHRGVAPATLETIDVVGTADTLINARSQVDAVTVTDEVVAYVAALARRTRDLPSVALGASPRAAVHLLAAARAAAALAGRDFVVPDDVTRMVAAVFRHRVVLRAEAELERYTPDDAIAAAVTSVPVPR
jgi:MoxR-like ATPase